MSRFVIPACVVMLATLAARAEPLAGTEPLTAEGDLASQMVEGIDRFLAGKTAASVEGRAPLWRRDVSSPQAYEQSIAANRARLAKIIGATDPREPFESPQLLATVQRPALVGRGEGFEAYAVRWPALRGVHGEGLLLKPTRGPAVADVVAIPDADQTPEMIAGLAPGVPPESQFARRLAESGCRVLVPALVDRTDTFSITPGGQRTNQPHREYVYRPAFEMGRHVIGYEVQKVLAAVDWFAREGGPGAKVGVIGYGEGGLLALYAAALDPRIKAACVSGHFGPREGLWREPIYRNVFGLLREFGDAELVSLVAPRVIVIEACKSPEVTGPPPPRDGRKGAAPGRLTTPGPEDVRREFDRARALVDDLAPAPRMELIVSGEGSGPFGSEPALERLLDALSPGATTAAAGPAPVHLVQDLDTQARLRRQIAEMHAFTQSLVRDSDRVRKAFWSKADRASRSPEAWRKSVEWYRRYFAQEVIGDFPDAPREPNVRTRKVYDEPAYVGYEVVMDVYDGVFAYGILLVPKHIKPGERRPVVVCQHGLEGRPRDLADPKVHHPAYHRFACRLAERGFVTYAPQNPYIFGDRFRVLQRKANPLGKTLFSVIVPQHRQTVEWLAGLPMADPGRIAFYGLSYGGKTAMRVPPLVGRYCLSICSADFNEWVWKNTSLTYPASYVGTIEYEIFEWDLGNTFNYAEMTGLIAPRPFMVERGHRDGVAPDEWVAHEYAKVRLLYADLKIPGRTRIEFFDGPHTINGVGTFEFLHEHLNWPNRVNERQDAEDAKKEQKS